MSNHTQISDEFWKWLTPSKFNSEDVPKEIPGDTDEEKILNWFSTHLLIESELDYCEIRIPDDHDRPLHAGLITKDSDYANNLPKIIAQLKGALLNNVSIKPPVITWKEESRKDAFFLINNTEISIPNILFYKSEKSEQEDLNINVPPLELKTIKQFSINNHTLYLLGKPTDIAQKVVPINPPSYTTIYDLHARLIPPLTYIFIPIYLHDIYLARSHSNIVGVQLYGNKGTYKLDKELLQKIYILTKICVPELAEHLIIRKKDKFSEVKGIAKSKKWFANDDSHEVLKHNFSEITRNNLANDAKEYLQDYLLIPKEFNNSFYEGLKKLFHIYNEGELKNRQLTSIYALLCIALKEKNIPVEKISDLKDISLAEEKDYCVINEDSLEYLYRFFIKVIVDKNNSSNILIKKCSHNNNTLKLIWKTNFLRQIVQNVSVLLYQRSDEHDSSMPLADFINESGWSLYIDDSSNKIKYCIKQGEKDFGVHIKVDADNSYMTFCKCKGVNHG